MDEVILQTFYKAHIVNISSWNRGTDNAHSEQVHLVKIK